VSVLLMGVNFKYRAEMASDIHTKFHEDWFVHSSNIKITRTSIILGATILVLLIGRDL
jgi:hypothetical protein